MIKICTLLIIASVLFQGMGCDHAVNCALDEHIEIDTDYLPNGTLGEEYYTEIKASVHNSIFDDAYDYHFELISGRLPDGLIFESRHDRGIIRGTPFQTGVFWLEVKAHSDRLERESYDTYDDFNCITYNDYQEYHLTINDVASDTSQVE